MSDRNKTAYISSEADKRLAEYLMSKGYEIEFVKAHKNLDGAISTHPDIYMCKLGTSEDAPIFFGDPERLAPKYPRDIAYNAVMMGRYFLHNLRHTDENLLVAAREEALSRHGENLTEIPVSQGYTKCNMVVIDDVHAITSDKGIARALKTYAKDIEVLEIAEGFVNLSGYKHGFLGGASGLAGDEIIFNGDLSKHPDYGKIKEFIENTGKKIKYFEEYPLTDIGSIFTT